MKTRLSDYHLSRDHSSGYQTGKIKQAVILAAGKGVRLQERQGDNPKCLIDLGEAFLIEYQLWALRLLGIKEIYVVVGYKADRVRRIVEPWGGICITNQKYEQTNSLYSLWLTKDRIKDTFILCNGDVLAHPLVYQSLADGAGSCLTYDSSSGTEPEHMKVTIDQGRVKSIGKKMPIAQISGENVGLLRFPKADVARLFDGVCKVLETEGEQAWAPCAVGVLAQLVPVVGINIAGIPWVEIDFPRDLDLARRQIWPEIKKCFSLKAIPKENRKTIETTDAKKYTNPSVEWQIT